MVTEYLAELNENVKGSYEEESPSAIIQGQLERISTFTLVLACNVPQTDLLTLAAHLWDRYVVEISADYGDAIYGFNNISFNTHLDLSP